MKKLVSPLVLALAAAVAGPALGEGAAKGPRLAGFASDLQTVPVMTNASGLQGATFETHVAIMNPTASAYSVTVTLNDATGAKRTATIPLAAGELKTYSNFLGSVFQLQGTGAVTLSAPESTGGTHNNRFILSVEVHTVGAGGWFGTAVPALEFAGTSSPSFAAGIFVDAQTRTNVGCYNQSAAANTIKVRVYNGAGAQIGTFDMALAANAWGQAGVPQSVTGGYVRFEPQDNAVCYAVVVNNQTNDGRFIQAVEYAP